MVEALTNLKNNKTGGKQDANGAGGVDQYAGLKKFVKGIKGRSGEFLFPRFLPLIWGGRKEGDRGEKTADLGAHIEQDPPPSPSVSPSPTSAPPPPKANGGSSVLLGEETHSWTVLYRED